MSVWKSDEKLLRFASLQDNVKMRRQIRVCANQVMLYIVSGFEASEASHRSQEAKKASYDLG